MLRFRSRLLTLIRVRYSATLYSFGIVRCQLRCIMDSIHFLRTLFLICVMLHAVSVDAQTTPTTQKDCETRGGKWIQFDSIAVCDLPTKDLGKHCSDKSDCQSACVASEDVPADAKTQGTCYGRTSTLGTCLNLVVAGAAQGTVCED